jgi:hypothetical protein
MRKRHFLIYYDNRVKEIIKTIPRTWAKANKNHFSKYSFKGKNHPTDNKIEKYLENNYGFIINNNQTDFVITYNFSQNIPLKNGKPFIII